MQIYQTIEHKIECQKTDPFFQDAALIPDNILTFETTITRGKPGWYQSPVQIIPPLSKLRVLAVEDNPISQRALVKFLEPYNLFIIDNVDDALTNFPVINPNIVLLDQNLNYSPDHIFRDGIEMAYYLRKKGVVIPIISISDEIESEELAAARRALLNDSQPKPFYADKLTTLINSYTSPPSCN